MCLRPYTVFENDSNILILANEASYVISDMVRLLLKCNRLNYNYSLKKCNRLNYNYIFGVVTDYNYNYFQNVTDYFAITLELLFNKKNSQKFFAVFVNLMNFRYLFKTL